MSTDVSLEHTPTLDLLEPSGPALSTTNDVPVVETKPDAIAAPKPEAEKPEVEAEDEVQEESAPPEKPEDPAANAQPKPAKGVQKRIDELVRQREEERAEKLRLLAIVEGYNKPKAEAKVEGEDQEPQRPVRDPNAAPEVYEQALMDYADAKASWSARNEVQKVLAEEARKAEEREQAAAQKAAQETYIARVNKAVEKYPDYKAVAESPDVTVSMPMAHAIMTSEHGPDIAYHLGKNPQEAARIASLAPIQQLVEVGLIVAKLTAPAPAPAAPAPKPAVSAAPKPIKPLESKGDTHVKSPDEESMEEYAARRTKELKAERRPGVR
jgi:hypothetical protein